MAYWLVKTEPDVFSYTNLVELGQDRWDGVKNFLALSFIRQIKPEDPVFIYHTGKERAIIGIAEAVSLPYPDPSLNDPRLLVFDIKPVRILNRSVSLKEIKANPVFKNWELVRQSRLSVMPVTPEVWQEVLRLSLL